MNSVLRILNAHSKASLNFSSEQCKFSAIHSMTSFGADASCPRSGKTSSESWSLCPKSIKLFCCILSPFLFWLCAAPLDNVQIRFLSLWICPGVGGLGVRRLAFSPKSNSRPGVRPNDVRRASAPASAVCATVVSRHTDLYPDDRVRFLRRPRRKPIESALIWIILLIFNPVPYFHLDDTEHLDNLAG